MRKTYPRHIAERTVTVRAGFMAYCKLLGVSWTHLNAVLKGERTSARLMARIKEECPELLTQPWA